MNREELKNYLPHREPMLLVDEAYLNEDGTAVGMYTVRGDEYFLQGHFPDFPVVPGVILCEILAQCASLLMVDELKGKRPLYTGMDNVKFRNTVHPGDKLEVHAEIVKMRPPLYRIRGNIAVDGKLCMQGEFTFALLPQQQTSRETT